MHTALPVRLNQWMTGLLVVLQGVIVFGGAATAYVPTGEAHPEMDPPVSKLGTFFTDVHASRDVLNAIKMAAGLFFDRSGPGKPEKRIEYSRHDSPFQCLLNAPTQVLVD